MMKQILAFSVVIILMASCKKNEQHCWTCTQSRTYYDDDQTPVTVVDSTYLCEMTPEEIHVREGRYTARQLLDVTYGDMHCSENDNN
ncbi:MAG: hypothetical protein EOP51_15625 [Sphingobacteriales bacterium]|nr:MAG: hypothetical protein EOP51_15625 [Sphingobacteriales bacterium]